MYLTIWRHGQAGNATSDRMRELTARGRDDITFGGQRFRAICEEMAMGTPDHIYYSEWLRTRQSADILATDFSNAQCCALTALMPGYGPAQVDSALDSLEPAEHLLLVSHQPLVSALVDYYLGEWGRVPALQPGAFATLSMDVIAAGCASLVCSAQPSSYELMV